MLPANVNCRKKTITLIDPDISGVGTSMSAMAISCQSPPERLLVAIAIGCHPHFGSRLDPLRRPTLPPPRSGYRKSAVAGRALIADQANSSCRDPAIVTREPDQE